MRIRTLVLLALAVVLAGGTAMLARSWLAAQRQHQVVHVKAKPQPKHSVLIARVGMGRGHILRPEDLMWQVWPSGSLDKNYIVRGGPRHATPKTFGGWVAHDPIAAGEPITEAKIVSPGSRGFLAAVLRPGMRAITIPITVTSGIAGFIFPGDDVDMLLTFPVPGGKGYAHKATETVLRNVRVIAIDQRLHSKEGQAVVGHTATFEVTPKETEAVALASDIGKVSLTLRSLVPAKHKKKEAAAEPSSANLAQLVSATRSAVSATPAVSAAPAVSATPAVSTTSAAPAASGDTIADQATYTVDSEINPLLPPMRLKGHKKNGPPPPPPPQVVTILRGIRATTVKTAPPVQSGKPASASKTAPASETASKGE